MWTFPLIVVFSSTINGILPVRILFNIFHFVGWVPPGACNCEAKETNCKTNQITNNKSSKIAETKLQSNFVKLGSWSCCSIFTALPLVQLPLSRTSDTWGLLQQRMTAFAKHLLRPFWLPHLEAGSGPAWGGKCPTPPQIQSSWNPWNFNYVTFYFVKNKIKLLILAGSAFYQIWLGWNDCFSVSPI